MCGQTQDKEKQMQRRLSLSGWQTDRQAGKQKIQTQNTQTNTGEHEPEQTAGSREAEVGLRQQTTDNWKTVS